MSSQDKSKGWVSIETKKLGKVTIYKNSPKQIFWVTDIHELTTHGLNVEVTNDRIIIEGVN